MCECICVFVNLYIFLFINCFEPFHWLCASAGLSGPLFTQSPDSDPGPKDRRQRLGRVERLFETRDQAAKAENWQPNCSSISFIFFVSSCSSTVAVVVIFYYYYYFSSFYYIYVYTHLSLWLHLLRNRLRKRSL